MKVKKLKKKILGPLKNHFHPKTQTGFCHQLKLLNLIELSKRIKKNEGYRNKAYNDKLNFKTIGYGHLIKKNEKKLLKGKFKKSLLIEIFNKDFKKAVSDFKKNYNYKKIPRRAQEVIIEMIYQLGIRGVLKFKKFNKNINEGNIYLAAFEMLNSRWNKQTPKRVSKLIFILIYKNETKR